MLTKHPTPRIDAPAPAGGYRWATEYNPPAAANPRSWAGNTASGHRLRPWLKYERKEATGYGE